MGVGWKVEGGASRLLLLLAGVLLLVAVTTTAGDASEEVATVGEAILHGSRAYCELKCQHHRDPVNKKRCVDFCIRWQLALDVVKEDDGVAITTGEDILHGSRAYCELKCQHHRDPVNKKRCVDFCIRWQLALDAVKEEDGVTITTGEDILRGSRAYCELKCQHHRDPVNKKRCVDFCIRWQLALGNVKEEDGAAAAEKDGVTITNGEDILRGSRAYCELKCQHHRDPVNKKRCVDFCIRWQLVLGNVKEEDGATAAEEDGVTITTDEDILHGSRAYCELKCQHHHDPVNKKRCVDFCIRWQLALGKVKEDGAVAAENDGVTITTGEDILHGSRAYCELKCQHHRDPVNKKRCVDFCIRWQLALGKVEEDGVVATEKDGVTITTGKDILRGSRAYCELKCQHHRDPVNKKRCVDFCIRWQLTLGNVKEEDGASAVATGNKAVDGTGKEDVRATVAAVGGAIRQVV